MAIQRVGLQAQFNTKKFQQGLNIYMRGLSQVNTVTGKTVSIVNSFNQTFSQLNSGMSKVGKSAQSGAAGMKTMSVGATALAVAIGNAASAMLRNWINMVKQLGREALKIIVFFERLELSINFFQARSAVFVDKTLSFKNALSATVEEARGLLIYVQRLAIASPFTTKQVGSVFRVSQAYGLLAEEAQTLLPLLLDLGAATGLDPQTLENAARALGQIRARGKLTGEEIRQLGNAGIPIRDILVAQLKITNQEFDKVLESGALLSNMVIPAIIDSLQDFKGAGEDVAFGTLGGLISAFAEIRDLGLFKLFGGIFQQIKPIMLEIVETINNPRFLASLQVIGEDLGGVIANGIRTLSSSLRGLVDSWNAVDPEVKQAIVVFGIAFIAISALIGVTGILIVTINALINPFVLVVGAMSVGLALWTTNAFGARDAMIALGSVVSSVGGALSGFMAVVITPFRGLVGILTLIGSTYSNILTLANYFKLLSIEVRFVSSVVRKFASMFSTAFANMRTMAVGFFTRVVTMAGVFVGSLRAVLTAIRALGSDVVAVIANLSTAFSGLLSGILLSVSRSFAPLLEAILSLANGLIGFASAIRRAGGVMQSFTVASTAAGLSLSDMSSKLGSLLTRVSSTLTKFFLQFIGGFKKVTDGVLAASSVIGDFARDTINSFADALSSAVDFGRGFVEAFASGVSAGIDILVSAFEVISRIITFWFSPGSPPRIAPNIDSDGSGMIDSWLGGMIATDMSPAFQVIRQRIKREAFMISKGAVKVLNTESKKAFGPGVVDGWVKNFQTSSGIFRPKVKDAVEEALDVTDVAEQAGYNVSQSFLRGLLGGLPVPNAPVNERLRDLLSNLGGGRELSRSGAEAISRFVDGFKDADFSAISSIAGIIRGYLGNLVDIGDLKDIDAPRILFDLTEEIAKGIQEFRKFGDVSSETFKNIQKAAAPAGEAAVKFVSQYLQVAKATAAVEVAQESLNQVTEYYKNLIEPLRRELNQLEADASQAGDAREIITLRRIANNQLLTEERRREAIAKIALIGKKRQLDALEIQRDVAVGAAEGELTAAEKIQEAAETKLSILRSTLELQNNQLSLVATEANLVERLNKEISSIREKQLSTLELQLKFAKLQRAELRDVLEAAKAKYILDSDGSTEIEKQNALLKLQEIAMNQVKRDSDAVSLGFDPQILRDLRDTAVVWDDLNIKGKSDEFADAGVSMVEGIKNLKDITQEWDDTLASVGRRLDEVKAKFLAAAKAINDNLPTFLKMFPEFEGGEPPILETLRKYKKLIIGVATAIAISKIIILFKGVWAAASLVYGVFAAILGSSVISSLAVAISGLAIPIAIALAALTLLSIGWTRNWFNMREVIFRIATGIKGDILSIGPFLIGLKDMFVDTFTKPFSKEGREQIRQDWADLRAQMTSKEGRDQFLTDLRQEGEDYINNIRAGITQTGGDVISGTLLGTLRQVRDTVMGDPTPKKIGEVTVDGIMSGLSTGDGMFTTWLNSIISPIKNAEGSADLNALGVSIGSPIGAGVSDGLLQQVEDAEVAASSFIDSIFNAMMTESGINSPSKRAKDTVGAQISLGVIDGVKDILKRGGVQKAFGGVFIGVLAEIKEWRVKVKEQLTVFNTMFTDKVEVLEEDVIELFKSLGLGATGELEVTKGDIEDELDLWNLSMTDAVDEIVDSIVGMFITMGTSIGTELATITTNISDLLGGDPGGLLYAIRETLLGEKDIIPLTIGEKFASAVAAGILSGKDEIQKALNDVFQTAFDMPGLAASGGSPSLSGVDAQFGSRPFASTANTTNNVSRTNVFNLNVNSATDSQGVVGDFHIMRSVASGSF